MSRRARSGGGRDAAPGGRSRGPVASPARRRAARGGRGSRAALPHPQRRSAGPAPPAVRGSGSSALPAASGPGGAGSALGVLPRPGLASSARSGGLGAGGAGHRAGCAAAAVRCCYLYVIIMYVVCRAEGRPPAPQPSRGVPKPAGFLSGTSQSRGTHRLPSFCSPCEKKSLRICFLAWSRNAGSCGN